MAYLGAGLDSAMRIANHSMDTSDYARITCPGQWDEPHHCSATFRDKHRYTIPTGWLHRALFGGTYLLLCQTDKTLAGFCY
ncbi:hypothetical protein DL89DRAFT_264386 [Linderina pennispora]|uniref:Uncharacterized protein n=1 Tax=Linderina pennispora TaxID=61395 RepID=A0A1Y1WLU9_9FUNG|nr:uncharacterized protein DL89DRAFT_264386 [Linderina pennispora]ORX74537.1 hypothetical protein DL89DRAFT_264386 [Linderina pennispora]